MDCLFCKIVSGEIPSNKVYEDEMIYAFHDINPMAPVHILIIPKEKTAPVSQEFLKKSLTLQRRPGSRAGIA